MEEAGAVIVDDWRVGLAHGLTYGAIKDPDNIYVALKRGSVGQDKALILTTLYIPPRLRRQGLAKDILTFLEQRSRTEAMRLVVGPIMGDENDEAWLGHICQTRGYQPAPPFMYIYRP